MTRKDERAHLLSGEAQPVGATKQDGKQPTNEGASDGQAGNQQPTGSQASAHAGSVQPGGEQTANARASDGQAGNQQPTSRASAHAGSTKPSGTSALAQLPEDRPLGGQPPARRRRARRSEGSRQGAQPEKSRGDAQEKARGKSKLAIAALSACVVVLLGLLGVYAAGIFYFQDKFFLHTTINGMDVSRKTVAEVEEQIAADLATYRLRVDLRGGGHEEISAGQIGYAYVPFGEVQAFRDSQAPFSWPFCLWETSSYSFAESTQFDEKRLEGAVDALACMDADNAEHPVDAYVDYLDGAYTVVREVEGNLLNRALAQAKIRKAVEADQTAVSLDDGVCYEAPKKRQTDPKLVADCETLNTFLQTDITYVFGEHRETLDSADILDWIVYGDGKGPSLKEKKARAFVEHLADTYDTAGKPRDFRTHDGDIVTVTGGHYGWELDQETETGELLACIREGYQGERYAVFLQTAVSWENSDLGDSYVEINLGRQHVWMYLNGAEIVSTDCVSGDMMRSDRTTPEGTYTLYYKKSPAVLEDEKKTYRTPVTYWMPFNGGIGLHDATWRGSFGGTIYQSNGSHGCINLPIDAAKTIYENIYEGMPIICYY